MTVSVIADQKFFGLVELGADGTVLYSRIERDGHRHYPTSSITGRNFFNEVAPFLNVAEFQTCLASFTRSSQQANTIIFTCQYEDGPLRVKILMARVRERTADDVTKSVLVHIRKAQ